MHIYFYVPHEASKCVVSQFHHTYIAELYQQHSRVKSEIIGFFLQNHFLRPKIVIFGTRAWNEIFAFDESSANITFWHE